MIEPVSNLSPSPLVMMTPMFVAITIYYAGAVIFLHAWRNR